MNLRDQIESDNVQVFSDFGSPVTITENIDIAPVVLTVAGLIRLTTAGIDMQTGQTVAARVGSVVVQSSAIAGHDIIDWVVAGTDINGTAFTAYVNEILPDDSVGLTVLMLRV